MLTKKTQILKKAARRAANQTGAQRSGSGGERTGRGGSKPKAGARDPEQARTRTGTPEEVAACRSSFTGWYLKKLLER